MRPHARRVTEPVVRVLFLQCETQDYQADALFHGLRSLLGANCVDVPRADSLYDTLLPADRARLRGRGFTLYGLLPDLPLVETARRRWRDELAAYDLVVVASIWRQWRLLTDPALGDAWRKVVLVDGEDQPAFFPYALHLRRTPRAYWTGRASRPCFKREWTGDDYGVFARWLPPVLRRRLPSPRRARPISFAIPIEKVADFGQLQKTKDFPRHLVDPDLAAASSGAFFSRIGSDQYVFETEDEYYSDLRQSRFGVTTRRAGWDCLRHYELAASGCVLCFRELDRKPATCAPHGLTAANSIAYQSPADLERRLQRMSAVEYADLLAQSRSWILDHTTHRLAERFLAVAVA
jgi:hypothetical protein